MSGKRPTDHLEPAAKKRGSERQLTKDNFDEEDEEVCDYSTANTHRAITTIFLQPVHNGDPSIQNNCTIHHVMQPLESGTFARASEDVIKQRKIIRARRAPSMMTTAPATASNPFANVQLTSTTANTTSTNPFSGISLFPPSTKTPAGAAEDGKPGENPQAAEENPTSASSGLGNPSGTATGGFGAIASGGGSAFGSSTGGFGALASKTGAGVSAGGGFGGLATFASTTSGVAFGTAAPLFGAKKEGQESEQQQNGTEITEKVKATQHQINNNEETDNPTITTTAAIAATTASSVFGSTPAVGTSLFGSAPKPSLVALPPEVPVATGEENEQTVFSSQGVLFEYDSNKQWKERGRGEVKVNVEKKEGTGESARMIMRQKGNLRLLLNAKLWGGMQLTKMEGNTVG